MTTQNPTRVVTGEVRLTCAHVCEPNSIQGGKPKYPVSLIIPKTDTTAITAIEKAELYRVNATYNLGPK